MRFKYNGDVMLKYCFNKRSCFDLNNFFMGLKIFYIFWECFISFFQKYEMFIFFRKMEFLYCLI